MLGTATWRCVWGGMRRQLGKNSRSWNSESVFLSFAVAGGGGGGGGVILMGSDF